MNAGQNLRKSNGRMAASLTAAPRSMCFEITPDISSCAIKYQPIPSRKTLNNWQIYIIA